MNSILLRSTLKSDNHKPAFTAIFHFIVALFFVFMPQSAQSQIAYNNSLSFSGGAYAASGFGTNPWFGARYNHFLNRGKYFVEGALGFGSIKSRILDSFGQTQFFESTSLYAYEFIMGYDSDISGSLPYFVAGFSGVNQGGQSRFAAVAGLGKRIPLYGLFNSNRWGLRYDVRDHIFRQKFNNAATFTTHNFVVTLGFEFYY